jgi:pantetheine-phosphate adenylyltransferase
MAQMNDLLFTEGTETILLMTDPKNSFISSSLIKEVASLGGCVDELVPPYVAQKIKEKLSK